MDLSDHLHAFLVDHPLYTPRTIEVEADIAERSLAWPSTLRRSCPACGVETNWQTQTSNEFKPGKEQHVFGRYVTYRCVQCGDETFAVWCMYECLDRRETTEETKRGEVRRWSGKRFRFRKIGQWNPWSIDPPPEVAKALSGPDVKLYKAALMNMSTGRGLGAVTYFRRIVENETSRILERMLEMAHEEGDTETETRVRTALSARNADERLRLAAEATPPWLRVGGHNPLKNLYGPYSVAIHSLDEESCLDVAQRLRTSLEYVIKKIRAEAEERKAYRTAMATLGDMNFVIRESHEVPDE